MSSTITSSVPRVLISSGAERGGMCVAGSDQRGNGYLDQSNNDRNLLPPEILEILVRSFGSWMTTANTVPHIEAGFRRNGPETWVWIGEDGTRAAAYPAITGFRTDELFAPGCDALEVAYETGDDALRDPLGRWFRVMAMSLDKGSIDPERLKEVTTADPLSAFRAASIQGALPPAMAEFNGVTTEPVVRSITSFQRTGQLPTLDAYDVEWVVQQPRYVAKISPPFLLTRSSFRHYAQFNSITMAMLEDFSRFLAGIHTSRILRTPENPRYAYRAANDIPDYNKQIHDLFITWPQLIKDRLASHLQNLLALIDPNDQLFQLLIISQMNGFLRRGVAVAQSLQQEAYRHWNQDQVDRRIILDGTN